MKAHADLRLVAVETEWRAGRSTKRLVLQAEGCRLVIDTEDPRSPETLMKRYPSWRLDLEAVES